MIHLDERWHREQSPVANDSTSKGYNKHINIMLSARAKADSDILFQFKLYSSGFHRNAMLWRHLQVRSLLTEQTGRLITSLHCNSDSFFLHLRFQLGSEWKVMLLWRSDRVHHSAVGHGSVPSLSWQSPTRAAVILSGQRSAAGAKNSTCLKRSLIHSECD